VKKILFVFGNLERAGAQLRTLEVCRALRQRYLLQCDFCALGRRPIQLQAEVEDIGGSIHLVSLRSPRFPVKFSHLLCREKYDIVDSEPLLLSGLILWLARRCHVPIRIASFWNTRGVRQGIMGMRWFMWLMRTLVKSSATHIVAVSQAALDSMFPPPWSSSCDCRVIYRGVPLSPFQGAVEHAEVREEFGWPLDSRIVVNVARFSPQKNHETILKATCLAYEKRRDIRLLLVGDGKLRDKIASLIDHYDLRGISAMAGLRTDVPRLLLASDIFFFPSLWEGLPGALLEALAAGLPAVTSDIAPFREIAEYLPSLLMAPANDAAKHAEHILAVMATSADRSLAQKHFMTTPFTLEDSVRAYSSLYGLA
jgi:glycosyltransferase involved in cell wall biosynthesis